MKRILIQIEKQQKEEIPMEDQTEIGKSSFVVPTGGGQLMDSKNVRNYKQNKRKYHHGRNSMDERINFVVATKNRRKQYQKNYDYK
jgi:hypothetical protein